MPFGRDFAAQLIFFDEHCLQIGEETELRWDGSDQLIFVEIECSQLCEAANLRGDRAAQLISRKVEAFQAYEVSQFGGDRTGQLVSVEVEPLQLGQISQLRGDQTAQEVVIDHESYQLGEGTQLRRDGAGQAVSAEAQLRDAAVIVCGDAVPCAERLAGQPVLIVHPVFAVGGDEERGQRDAVGVAAGLVVALSIQGGRCGRLGEGDQACNEQKCAAV